MYTYVFLFCADYNENVGQLYIRDRTGEQKCTVTTSTWSKLPLCDTTHVSAAKAPLHTRIPGMWGMVCINAWEDSLLYTIPLQVWLQGVCVAVQCIACVASKVLPTPLCCTRV